MDSFLNGVVSNTALAGALALVAFGVQRYYDVTIREVEVGKITEDVAFLKYVYDCKVEEAGQVQTYRDRQSMQIWTQKDGEWLLRYTTTFILTGGE